jgi:vacuolar-type H+-ATPase subunit H
MIALVVVVAASSSVASSAVYAVKNVKDAVDSDGKETREAKKRARQERAEARENASKEANESAQAERDEAERKKKEAERIEKESSKWAALLNNFMVAHVFKGDVVGLVKDGVSGVPEELVPHVLKKRRKRNNSNWNYLPCTGHEYRLDPVEKLPPEEWDLFFASTQDNFLEVFDTGVNEHRMTNPAYTAAPGTAFEATQCYEDKTKGLPDFYSLNDCERLKRMEILHECGGPKLYWGDWCGCKKS